eukprot:INCI616.4.p2 GENE.INCI616.4~~INCI616.4.p2  ORF type:complete len:101 (+),score=26.52 INCI616.4:165-467(+)
MEVDAADGSVLHTSFGSATVRFSGIVVLGTVAILAVWSRRSSLCPTAASVPGASTSSAQDSSYSRVQIVDVAATTATDDEDDDAPVLDHDGEPDSHDSEN